MESIHPNHRGFTLVELIVVLAIIGVIMGITLTGQSSFNKTYILQNAAYDVALTLRNAEVYGLGSHASGMTTNAGYGVHFQNTPAKSFTFFADTSPSPNASNCHGLPFGDAAAINAQPGDCAYSEGQDQKVTDYTLGNGLTIQDLCAFNGSWVCSLPSLDVVFARPNPDAFITANGSRYSAACLSVSSPQGGQQRYVSVSSSGEITANATSCAGSQGGGGGSCTPNCYHKVCGSDGCGGVCGSCSGGQSCAAGSCVSCVPNCTDKVCGDDGCGSTCGICSGSQDVCESGACVCQPACDGKVCGDDGCGGSCGSCSGDQSCMAGSCVNNAVDPTLIQLSQLTRSKNFKISWTGGQGSGTCKLQFFASGSTWTDITSATNLDCEHDHALNTTTYTLNADGWKASWNGTHVRMVRNSDQKVIGTFTQALACAVTAGYASPTPTIDEDCNGYWDNTTTSGGTSLGSCYIDSVGSTPGGAYTCIAPIPSDCQPGAATVAFYDAYWNGRPLNYYFYYNDTTCTALSNTGACVGLTLYATSGTIPLADDNGFLLTGACQIYGGTQSRKAGANPLATGTCVWSAYTAVSTLYH